MKEQKATALKTKKKKGSLGGEFPRWGKNALKFCRKGE